MGLNTTVLILNDQLDEIAEQRLRAIAKQAKATIGRIKYLLKTGK